MFDQGGVLGASPLDALMPRHVWLMLSCHVKGTWSPCLPSASAFGKGMV
jgi:hypothetical protein